MSTKNIIDTQKFLSFEHIESAYILGLAWADGYLAKRNDRYYTLSINGIYKDLSLIEKHFDKFGIFGKFLYMRKTRAKYESYSIYNSDRVLCTWLEERGFRDKICPSLILEDIPKEMHYMWFRGYSDGDGCFYIGKHQYQYSVSGNVNQDFRFMESKFEELGITRYQLKNRTHKSKEGSISNSSFIRISNKEDVKKFGNYIYKDNVEIGLPRKYEKYKNICHV